jgi:5-methylcytosine-specific restriction endonuclease McrA
MERRICKECGVEQPIEAFSARCTHRNGRTYVGRRYTCRSCANRRLYAQRKERALQSPPIVPEERRCTGCGEVKPAADFHRHLRDGLSARCKECCKVQYQENREAIVARAVQWVHEHPERRAATQARGRQRWNNVRRSRITEAGGSYTQAEWEALCVAHGYKCVRCGEPKPLTVDHVVPVSLGGTSDIGNIQPLCQSCNSRKGNNIEDYRYAY